MAEDRKDRPESSPGAEGKDLHPAMPNRDRRREPPVIDARPEDVREAAAPVNQTPAEPKSEPEMETETAPKSEAPSAPKSPAPEARSENGRDPSPARSERPRANWAAPLLGGVAGAAIALAAGYALTSGRYYSASETQAAIAAALSRASGETSAVLAPLQKKAGEDAARQAAATDAVAKRLADLESRLGGALKKLDAAPSAPAAPTVDLSPLEAGLGDLEKRIGAIEAALNAPKTEARADPENKAPEANATAAPPPALAANLAALSERLRAIETRPAPRAVDLAPLQARLQRLEEKLAPLESALGKSAALGDSIGERLKSMETGKARADAAALAAIARTLAEVAAAGDPFADLLKAAQALGADAEAVRRLTPSAPKGVLSAGALASQFAPLGEAMLEARRAPAANASLSEKIAASAGRLVRLRPAEDTTEETVEALVARINATLRAGRLAEAQALFARLPEDARSRAQDWALALQARLDVERSTQSILSAALSRLSRP